ncbi:MAG TPA: GSCFA domain-containing protein [Bacteroidia bacterium]|jgi:hypothetical protein|nr:GSCFA domain-containing protein [Bacteroidia bacterium]
MNFHLQFQVPSFSSKLKYDDALVFIGSCFAEHMTAQLQQYKFNTLLNPHGILYNPQSIATSLHSYINKTFVNEQDLFYADGIYHSWQHHSQFSNASKELCLQHINEEIQHAHTVLKKADWLFVTLGSAYVYKHKKTNAYVSNCHKQPSQEFTKELLSLEKLLDQYKQLIVGLQNFNSQLKIVFTVSPVRYVRDGVIENTRSKARLFELIHALTDSEKVIYFPAYELVIDDLRDYRFYKADLVHPTDQAIEYVFGKLTQAAFDDSTQLLFEKIKDVVKAREHRVFQENTAAHQKFKTTYFNRCKQLNDKYPFLSLTEEMEYFR